MWVRKLTLVLVMAMLGSVVMPAMAVSKELEEEYCKCSNLQEDMAGIDVRGLEKSELVAKTLKDNDVQRLIELLSSKGYATDLKSARVGKIFSQNGVYKGVIIPMLSKNGKAELIYILANGVTRIGAVEVLSSGVNKTLTLYYIDENDNIKTVTVKGSQNCWNCIWQCTRGVYS